MIIVEICQMIIVEICQMIIVDWVSFTKFKHGRSGSVRTQLEGLLQNIHYVGNVIECNNCTMVSNY